ncbi:MAG: manganese efflux pump [Acidobacteriota bacterium]|nr:manganese efflux pump [Acidobacteriota bacterium]
MGVGEILLLGLALSADAFSVTISNSFAYGRESRRRLLLMPLLFGLFQGLMPLVGYFLGGLAATLIERYAGIVTLVILGVIGGNMVREGMGALLHPDDGACPEEGVAHLTLGLLVFQAVATAIDAFAVGVSLRAQAVGIWSSSLIICCTTAACCVVALAIGRRLGCLLGDRAEVVGGIVLLGIGLRAFLS